VKEFNFNMIINYILLKDWKKAVEKLSEELNQQFSVLQQSERSKAMKQLYFLRAMSYKELGKDDLYKKDLTSS